MTTPGPRLDSCGCCEAKVPAETIANPPGLPSLAYRLGTHGSFLERMLARLPLQTVPGSPPAPGAAQNRPLTALTTRAADDPAIALLDSWAITADVLTFYQERIANEGFLRTATERRSVLELARAIGYELNPGVAASTYLAFTVESAQGAPRRATIPAGTRVLSVPGQGEKPQTFETIEAIEAKAEWNTLLPVVTQPQILTPASTQAWLAGVDTQLRDGDTLLIIFDASTGSPAWVLRTVSRVALEPTSGRTRVSWTDPLHLGSQDLPASVPATSPSVYAMRQRAALFGHDAPDWRAMPLNVMSAYVGFKVPDDPSKWTVLEWPNFQVPTGSTSIDLDAAYPKIVPGSLAALQTPLTIGSKVRATAGAAGATNEVQFAVALEDGRLLHTIRYADGSWQPAGDLGGVLGITGQVQALAAASGSGGEVQFAIAMQDGRLLHTIRHADGSWQPVGDMGGVLNIAGQVQSIAAGGTGSVVQFALAMQDGRLLHTIRFADGTWQPPGDMAAAAGIAGTVQAVTAASGGANTMQFAIAMQDGRLLHTIRFADGSWQPVGDMAAASGIIAGQVDAITAAPGSGGEVQFAVAMHDGRLLHTIRFAVGSWQPAGNLAAAAGLAGPVQALAAAPGGTAGVQFAAAMQDGRLLHTIRHVDVTWQPAGDMAAAIGITGPLRAIAGANGATAETQFVLAAQDGHLWHTIRKGDGSWQAAGDMAAAIGVNGQVQAVAAAADGNPGEVQFAVAMQDGHLWHTIRHKDMTWQQAGDMAGVLNIAGQVQAIAAAPGATGEVQFALSMQDGRLLHTIRKGDGSWTGAGNMANAASIAGQVDAVAAAPAADGEVQFALAMHDGRLLHTLRRANGSWTGAGDMAAAAGIVGGVRALAAGADATAQAQFVVAMQDGRLLHTVRRGDGSWSNAKDMAAAAGITAGQTQAVAAATGGSNDVQFAAARQDGVLLHTIRHAVGNWQPAGDMRAAAIIEAGRTGLYDVVSVVTRARTDFTLSRQVTSLTLDPSTDLRDYPLRSTVVFAQSAPLALAGAPIADPIDGYRIVIDGVITGLDTGRTVIVTAKRSRVRVQEGPPLTMVLDDGSSVQLQFGDTLVVIEPPQAAAPQDWRLQDVTGRVGTVAGVPSFRLMPIPAAPADAPVSEVAWVDHLEGTSPTTLVLQSSLRNWFDRTTVAVAANVARGTHGESAREVLGSGNAAQPNQRFKLRKPPLTFVAAPTPTGGQGTLQVWIDEVRWDDVPSLYQQPPDGRAYTVRLDDDGTTSVIFGDGAEGRRPPTGAENITAVYRSGMGLQGQVDAGKLTLMQTRPFGVRDVVNPLAATGAAPAESLDEARHNAPLTVLTINRLVSLKDFENFSSAFAGIAKAQAVPAWDGQRRVVYVTLAGVGGKAIDPGSAPYVNLRAAIGNFGDPVRVVRLQTYEPVMFRLSAEVLPDPDRKVPTVLAAVTTALEAAYAFDARSFGQPVTAAEITTVIQGVAGVTASRLRKLYLATDSSGPDQKEPPAFLAALSGRWDDTTRTARPAQLLLLDPNGLTVSEMAP